MNVANRFKELRSVVAGETGHGCPGEITQATALLVLAEVIQGSTMTMDVNLHSDVRNPVRVLVEER